MDCLGGLHPQRVESGITPGLPDIYFIGGWIECKHVNGWPARGGPLRLSHFTPQQKAWHRMHYRCGGNSFVMLQVGRDYLLFDGHTAVQILGEATEGQLRGWATAVWKNSVDRQEFRRSVSTTE